MPKGKTQKEHGQSSKKHKKVALGRGLDALLPEIEGVGDSSREYFQCDIEQIRPNRYQPRIRFADTELEELSRSIKEQGVLQPLLVRKDKNGYELVLGQEGENILQAFAGDLAKAFWHELDSEEEESEPADQLENHIIAQ